MSWGNPAPLLLARCAGIAEIKSGVGRTSRADSIREEDLPWTGSVMVGKERAFVHQSACLQIGENQAINFIDENLHS